MKNKFIFIFLILIGIIIYYILNNNTSSILNKNNLRTSDVLSTEGYSLDGKKMTQVLLAANKEYYGIFGITYVKFGVWKPYLISVSSTLDNTGTTITIPIMKNWGDSLYVENHIFFSKYINTSKKPLITGIDGTYINVDYFDIDNKVLLFAHAITGKNNRNFNAHNLEVYINLKLE